ncbi:hypothetical protein GCM10028820_17600 [Tessaracoccus terricola]
MLARVVTLGDGEATRVGEGVAEAAVGSPLADAGGVGVVGSVETGAHPARVATERAATASGRNFTTQA